VASSSPCLTLLDQNKLQEERENGDAFKRSRSSALY
jgi:hypothetical protein